MKNVDWKVEGMTCSNCALSVTKYLQKEGMEKVIVNPISGAVSFSSSAGEDVLPFLKKGIHSLGYTVLEEGADAKGS
ncbi:MAG: cation transporter, partial [Ferruginibacter sp.]